MEFKKHTHFSQELEEAILGACLIEKLAIGRIYDILEVETFYFEAHKTVYKAIREMYEASVPVDIFTVSDWLINKYSVLEILKYDTGYFLVRLTNSVVSSANLEYHSYLVKEMWRRRRVLEIKYRGLESDLDPSENIKEINQELNKVLGGGVKSEWKDMTALMVELYQHQAEMQKTGGIGLKTGLKAIDKENGGLQPGQMVAIGARPSVGKSAFAGGMAIEIAKQGKTVGIISLEMSNTEIAARLAAIDTDTDFAVVYRGLYFDQREAENLYNKIGKQTSQLPIYVSDKTDVNALEIKSKAMKLKHLHGLDCLIVDYLQLIEAGESYNRTRENEISKISRSLKVLAKEMEIPVIILCQLNREVTKRKGQDRYPQLSDFRESGSIEQDADVVMFLHSDWMSGITENENGQSTEGKADLVVRKWRNGKSNFIVPLNFEGKKMKFTEANNNFQAAPKNYYEKDENPF